MNGSHPVLVGVLIALFGASLGFGGSQMFIVGDVKANTSNINNLKDADVAIRATQIVDTQRTSAEMNRLSDLFGKNLELNRELIQLVRVQNELLDRRK